MARHNQASQRSAANRQAVLPAINDGEERQTSNKIAKQQNVQSNKIDDQEAANILLQLQRRPDKQS